MTVDTNYKSRLIEWGQKNKSDIQLVTEDHRGRRNRFNCLVTINGEEKGRGEGASKKEAEQNAAKTVIDVLREEADGNIEI